jgi:hypothetical protein
MSRRLLLALAGLLIVFGASIWTYEQQGPPLADPERPVATLSANQSIRQQLALDTFYLQGFMLAVDPLVADSPLTLTLRLQVAESGLPVLRVASQAWQPQIGEQELSLRFEPLRQPLDPFTTTGQLELQLELAGPANARVELLGGSLDPARGELYQNGETLAAVGLALRPSYQRRLLDPIWPVSAMAAGRSGILGWPPLYALLAYAVLWMFCASCIRLWRGSHEAQS